MYVCMYLIYLSIYLSIYACMEAVRAQCTKPLSHGDMPFKIL